MTPRIGELCAGYAGLGMAVEAVTGGRTAWLCENDAAPSALLAYRFPDLHNYGDLKALDWADDAVDILTGGFPCQPFSGAGKRLGLDDPRHLFPWIARGIERMRPPLVLLENVRGHLSLGFDVVLAELDRVGYDVRWTLLRAADVGAPHGRSRLWIAARAREVGGWPAPVGEPTAWAEQGGWVGARGLFGSIPADTPGTAGVMVHGLRWDSEATVVNSGTLPARKLLPTPFIFAHCSAFAACAPLTSDPTGEWGDRPGGPCGDGMLSTAVALLPTPTGRDHKGANQRQDASCLHGALLPTPRAQNGEDRNQTCWYRPDGQPQNLENALAPERLLPTPVAADGGGPRASSAGWGLRDESRVIAAAPSAWGPYAAAIARWERVLGRPAPPPTEQGRNGPRLSPKFVEWLMGLPTGWVTDVPGVTRNAALKMLGNGGMERQGAAAYALLGVSPALWAQVAA